MPAGTKVSGYVLLGLAAYWLYREGQPRAKPLEPPSQPRSAFAFAVNPRYLDKPIAPNGALPADPEETFPKLPYSVLLQGPPPPGRANEPTLVPWGQWPAYSQPVGPEFLAPGRRKP